MTSPDLWNTLEDLTEEQFKHFKWFLKQDEVLDGFSGISVARLEKADRQDTVDLMVQNYQGPGALKVTLKVLENIKRNDLAQCLLQTSSGPEDPKSHNSVSLNTEYGRKKAKLGATKAEIKLKIQERRMKIWEINRSVKFSSKSAEKHIADSVQAFAVLQQSVESSLANLIDAIEGKRETTRMQAEGFVQELEQEISELTKRLNEVEQLSRTEDHADFLQSFSFVNALPPKNWTEVSIPPPSYGLSVGTSVNQLVEIIAQEKEKLISKAKLNRVQQFAKDVTLDADTANPYLILSNDGKEVYCGDVERILPDNPERFKPALNVLGKPDFSSGRFYYEVGVKGKTSWDLGVVKESIDRKGSISASPENGYWTICLREEEKYKAFGACLIVNSPLKKVGVFVDYEKSVVSFYDVDSADLIHSFTDCSFTEKLYPFFSPGCRYNGKNSTPLIISPVNDID
ncbi:pyrin [Etheostoma spectabile]|uniref:pyrin n=1 Tax=Etheostoma spectabile TaxID=54343 RepID=UPI0013AEEB05|nr:pyrin-like [Etheostoma spectabile]XP_032360981.1 pyrin-like [Etheostoma spectabile]XP_032360982.1 pyrin-like [Etheostoma spectabile]